MLTFLSPSHPSHGTNLYQSLNPIIGLALGLAKNLVPGWTRIIPSAWGEWQLEPLEPSPVGHRLKVDDLGRGPMHPGENCSVNCSLKMKSRGFPTKMIYRWWKMVAFPHVNLSGRVSSCFMTKSQFANWTITTRSDRFFLANHLLWWAIYLVYVGLCWFMLVYVVRVDG